MSRHEVEAGSYQCYVADAASTDDFTGVWDKLETIPTLLAAEEAVVIAVEDTDDLTVGVSIEVGQSAGPAAGWEMLNTVSVTFSTGALVLYGGYDQLPDRPVVRVEPGDYEASLAHQPGAVPQEYLLQLRQV